MLRLLNRAFKWLFLLTLPLTSLPIFMGTLGGILLPIFENRHITSVTENYLEDLKRSVSDWGVGGDAPSFRQFQDKNNGFHLTRVNSDDWWSKMGFLLPIEYSDREMLVELDTPIDKTASLQTLMREKASREPREQWLILTNLEWIDWDGWNAAFDDLLRYRYTDPVLNNSGFHFAECSTSSTASFLCSVWNTRNPALVHFLVEDEPLRQEDVDPDLTYKLPYRKMLPVTVRIIELGLQDAYIGLPWTTFPSKEKQLRAIVGGDRMYEQFEPFNPEELLHVRFNEYMDRLFDARGTVLNYLNEMDWWMARNIIEPLGIESIMTVIHTSCFNMALVIAMLVDIVIVRPLRTVWNGFLGTPLPGDVVFAGMEEDAGNNAMDDIFGFGSAMEQMFADVERMASKAGATAAGETSAAPSTAHAEESARF